MSKEQPLICDLCNEPCDTIVDDLCRDCYAFIQVATDMFRARLNEPLRLLTEDSPLIRKTED